MNEDFIKEVAQSIHFGQPELIEKDLIIHLLLSRLAENPFFYNNFLFKGGTCLVKCYLGYYRFSEDIDLRGKTNLFFQEPLLQSGKKSCLDS